MKPSEYFKRQVRVAAFSYEDPPASGASPTTSTWAAATTRTPREPTRRSTTTAPWACTPRTTLAVPRQRGVPAPSLKLADQDSLEGRVALITGSGSGQGRAAAVKFAERGAAIAVNDINDEGKRRRPSVWSSRAAAKR